MKRTHLFKHCCFSCKPTVATKTKLQQCYNTDTTNDIQIIRLSIRMCLVFAIFVVLLLMSPITIGTRLHEPLIMTENIEKDNNIIDTASINDKENHIGLRQLFTDKEYWVLYTISILMAGTGFIMLNNILQIVNSIEMNKYNCNIDNDNTDSRFDANLSDALVSISTCNFSGYLISGFISDYFANNCNKKNKFGKTYNYVFGLTMCICIMVFSHLILCIFLKDNNIFIVCFCGVLNGIPCGLCLTLMII